MKETRVIKISDEYWDMMNKFYDFLDSLEYYFDGIKLDNSLSLYYALKELRNGMNDLENFLHKVDGNTELDN